MYFVYMYICTCYFMYIISSLYGLSSLPLWPHFLLIPICLFDLAKVHSENTGHSSCHFPIVPSLQYLATSRRYEKGQSNPTLPSATQEKLTSGTENYMLTEVKEAPAPPKLTKSCLKRFRLLSDAHGIQMYKPDFSNHSQLKPAKSWFNSTSESLAKNLSKVFIDTKKPKPLASVSLIITGDLIITGNFDM